LPSDIDVVTGAFGYIGRYITAQLIASGRRVKTITTHIDKPNPFGTQVIAQPYNFNDPVQLTETLYGADTLYNTYWIRFEHSGLTFDQAVENTRILFECAARAGVKKILHVSVTQASADSELPYYAGKGQQEQILERSGVSYAIVRPTLVFGKEDVLVNNIAWLIRKFPFFPIMGDGQYRLQPIFVDDLAKIAIQVAMGQDPGPRDVIGPETYTFDELVRLIAATIGRKVRFVNVSPSVGISLGKVLNLFLDDVLLTRNELRGLMQELLTSRQEINGTTRLSEWLAENRQTVGLSYTSELARHFYWTPTR